MFQILSAPNPLLAQTLKPVHKVDERIIRILKDMEQTLANQKDPPGVGLAANQVGINLRIFLAVIDKKIIPFINPRIIKQSKELYPPDDGKNHLLEGCLSLHGYYGLVRRPKWIILKAITLPPNTPKIPNTPKLFMESTKKYTNFPAQIIQHEMDHLNGHMFVEHVIAQNQKLYKIKGQDKKGKTVFEEVELV